MAKDKINKDIVENEELKEVKTKKKKTPKKISLTDTVESKKEENLESSENLFEINSEEEKSTSKDTKKTKKSKEKVKEKSIKVKKVSKKKETELSDELFSPREKFGFEQEEIQDRLKESTINNIINGTSKINTVTEDKYTNSDFKFYDKGLKRYLKSRILGNKNKKTLLTKLLTELVVFFLITIILVISYLFNYKEDVIQTSTLKTLSLIILLIGIGILEFGFKVRRFNIMLRGFELMTFSSIYVYYLNVITNKLVYPSVQKNIIIIIYGYFVFKLIMVYNIERLRHQKTYIDIRELTIDED